MYLYPQLDVTTSQKHLHVVRMRSMSADGYAAALA